MKPMRVRIEAGDMDNIVPGSPLYKRVAAQMAEEVLEPNHKKYLEAAKEKFQKDGELEFDDDAAVSVSSDGGAYVMCWVWIYDTEAGIAES